MRASILQKTVLIVLGIFLFFVVLEAALNIGGFLFSELQEYRNLRSFKQKGAYRILCLGESTTAVGGEDSYPSQLESILNQRKIGIRFSLINKGAIGISTSFILSRLESNLNKYHPDMVVAMMGCNDGGTMYYQDIPESDTWLFRHCRVFRFSRTIYMHILKKLKKEDIYGVKSPRPNQGKPLKFKGSSNNPVTLNPKDDSAYLELGQLYIDQGRLVEAEEAFKKAIEINPNDDGAYFELGRLYSRYYTDKAKFKDVSGIDETNGFKNDLDYIYYGCVYFDKNDIPAAEASFLKALEFNPRNDIAYTGLGCVYINKNDIPAAETLFAKALELNPENSLVYIELAWISEERGRLSEAEELLKKAIEANPYDDVAYVILGMSVILRKDFAYARKLFEKARYLNSNNLGAVKGLEFINQDIGSIKSVNKMFKLSRREKWEYIESYKLWRMITDNEISLTEESFKKAIILNEKNSNAYYELGRVYIDRGKIPEAEEAFKKAIDLNPGDFMAYAELGWLFVKRKDFVKAEELFRKAVEVNPNNDKAYGALVTIAKERKDFDTIKKYHKKADDLRFQYYIPETIANYRKLHDILEKRKIKLVCVQYPVRGIKPLKNIFAGQKDVIFVDNEEIFKQALLKASYKEYFTDMFGGDFGHCTPKGNKLLAENIANVILKKVFNK